MKEKKIFKGKPRIDKLVAAGALIAGAAVINNHRETFDKPWFTPDAGVAVEGDEEQEESPEINFDRAEGGVPDAGADAGSETEEENEDQIAEDNQETRLTLNLGRTKK